MLVASRTEPGVVHVGLSQPTNEPANGWNYPPPHCLLSTDCSPQCPVPQYAPCFHLKRLNPCQESAKAIVLPTVGPLKVSSQYCHLSSFPTENLQLPQKSILQNWALSVTDLHSPPVPPCHRPPHKLEQNVTFPHTRHATQCAMSKMPHWLTIFTLLGQVHKTQADD